MKKIFMIALTVAFTTNACSDDTEKPAPAPPILPEATIVAFPEVLGENENGTFTVTLNEVATEEIIISVSNTSPNLVTVPANEIKIPVGETTVTVTFRSGNNIGQADIAFTSETAVVKTPKIKITIIKGDHVDDNFPFFAWGTYFGMTKAVFGTTTLIASCADGMGPDKPLMGNDDYGMSYVCDDLTGAFVPLADGMPFKIYADNFTSTNGKYDILVYVDWNGDGKFDEATDLIKKEQGIDGSSKTEVSGIITIPANAAASSRARIIIANEDNDIVNGVGEGDSGYFMEFTYVR